jgi:hypothetical protein
MSKQNNEEKDAKFRRISNARGKKVIYELGRLVNMTSQPSYTITDVDAEKLLVAINSAYVSFADLYQKLAKGQSVKSSKKEISDIF